MKNRTCYGCRFCCWFSASAQAASTVCVFDLLGKAGDSYKMMEEWALAAKGWGTEITSSSSGRGCCR